MKKFNELTVGDSIYYWDHGKLRKQIVKEIEIKDEIQSSTDWYGITREDKRTRIKMKAGPKSSNRQTTYNFIFFEWNPGGVGDFTDNSYTTFLGTRKFSCIEAARHWLRKNEESSYERAMRAKRKYDREIKSSKAYKEALAAE